MKIDWDLVKELCHLEDEGEIPLGWRAIIAITFLVVTLIYEPTILYFSL